MTQVWFPRKNLPAAIGSVGQSIIAEGTALLASGLVGRLLSRWGPWSAGGLTVALLWPSEWQLLLATGCGIGGVKLTFWLLTHRDQLRTLRWLPSLRRPQTHLLAASGSGGMVALGTYLATMVWSDADNPWIAAGIILQGLGSVATVGLLLWQGSKLSTPSLHQDQGKFESSLWLLANGDRLQKLVALRHLSALSHGQRLSREERRDLWDALEIFLDIEDDPLLQRTAIALLHTTGSGTQPIDIPQSQRLKQTIKIPLNEF